MSKLVIQVACKGNLNREVYNVDKSPTNDFCVSPFSGKFHCNLDLLCREGQKKQRI